MPQKYLRVKGIATFVHHAGPTLLPERLPDLSRGQTVLCLHGAGGNGHVFEDLRARLDSAHSPLAFDQPGHGRSGELDSLGSIERMADFTAELCEGLRARRPILLGHSMGGAVALQVALAQRLELGGLILVSSAAAIAGLGPVIVEQREIVAGRARRAFRREAYSPAATPEVMRRGFMEDLKTDPRATLGDLLAIDGFDVSSRLAEIALPALVLVGEDEIPALREGSEALAAGLPNGRLSVLPKAGHMLPLEQPEAVADAILEFLEPLS